jgi:hypothetical protein
MPGWLLRATGKQRAGFEIDRAHRELKQDCGEHMPTGRRAEQPVGHSGREDADGAELHEGKRGGAGSQRNSEGAD